MMLVDAVEPFATIAAPSRSALRDRCFTVFLEMLLALANSEHPYAYLRATEPRARNPSA